MGSEEGRGGDDGVGGWGWGVGASLREIIGRRESHCYPSVELLALITLPSLQSPPTRLRSLSLSLCRGRG